MQFSYLFLVLAVAAVNSELTDINHFVDVGFQKTNEYLRKHRITSSHLPEGTFGTLISFSESELLGVDSFKRTDNCTLETDGNNATFDFHYGLGLYQQSFKYINLKINDKEMSGGYRIRNNSVHMHFTVHNIGHEDCSITLHDMSIERLGDVEFYSSRPEFDLVNVNEFFEKALIPYLNQLIKKDLLEKELQRFTCRQRHLDVSQYMPLIHMTILGQLGVSLEL